MLSVFWRAALGACLAALLAPATSAQAYATTVVSYNPGGGFGFFDPSLALGGPRGAGYFSGSLDVCSLGGGGDLTLGFGVTITDGPGADFTVFENGFWDFGLVSVFAEVMFVEVSTNGVDFARFPSSYFGPDLGADPFQTVVPGSFRGVAGGLACFSNVDSNTLSPLDPVLSGGDAFDLADLADHPLVLGGLVDLSEIHYVRVVDIAEGVETDDAGNVIWDLGGTSSADIDAVAVLNHTGNQTPGRPTLEMFVDVFGHLNVIFEDPDGLEDIVDINSSVSQIPFGFVSILQGFLVLELTSTRAHLWLKKKLEGSGWLFPIAFSITDSTGLVCGEQFVIQD